MDGHDAKRLEKIDKLYRLRLDQHIALPQLIVVGDQSSGKSSVLEALTNGLPFPRDSGLCTRFPTQIVFKRSPSTKVEVSIITAEENSGASTFEKRELPTLEGDQLLKIISEACDCMGLPQPGQTDQSLKSFSLDMLKIELSGPNYEHFSVIDLPGLFRKPTPGQTTAEDIVLVRQMITKYMENPRSIILAVVPANVDIATQEIVHMAEQADPGRKRTLGVLTKPDLVDAGAEDKVLQLLQPRSSELGYAVVCNRGQRSLLTTTAERNAKELTFFNSAPWHKVPRSRVGIAALKSLFNKLIRHITRKTFENVVHDIETKLESHLLELEKIGPARNDSTAQRMYLLQLATDYQSLICEAMQSFYGRATCFDDKEMRLTSLIIKTSKAFSDLMFTKGYKRSSRTSSGVDNKIDVDEPASTTTALAEYIELGGQGLIERAALEFSELRFFSIFHIPHPQYSEESIPSWIGREYHGYRSLGIGGLSPSLYQVLFAEHTGPWISLARSYLVETIIHIHRFLYRLLKHVCKDTNIAEAIWSRITSQLKKCYSRASEHLALLLEVERDGNLGTLNHYLADTIAKINENRTLNRLKDKATLKSDASGEQPLLRLSDVTAFHQSNEEQQINHIMVTLAAYCNVARKRFVDNVYMQVVDHFLVTSNKSPLKVLCSAWVGSLSDNDLAEIAGETESVRHRRKVLQEEIESFQAGLAILRA